ncbi:MAG: hypothetical protein HQL59_12830 [Magnetococcales bacterium]|nr:hypothetical protein [Magnetococcales bacterium]
MLSWIALGGGGLLTLFGFFKIVSNGFRFLLWVVLLSIGSVAVEYGLDHPPPGLREMGITPGAVDGLRTLVGPGKELSYRTLAEACAKLPEMKEQLNPGGKEEDPSRDGPKEASGPM